MEVFAIMCRTRTMDYIFRTGHILFMQNNVHKAKSDIVICIPDGGQLHPSIWQALKELNQNVWITIYSRGTPGSYAENHWSVVNWDRFLPLLVIDQKWI